MIVVGAGGFAKQLIPSLQRMGLLSTCLFYDDVTEGLGGFVHQNFKTLRDEQALKEEINQGNKEFILAIGNPHLRESLALKIESFGGEHVSLCDRKSSISQFDTYLGKGVIILEDVIIEPSVNVGHGTLINLRSLITHDSTIGNYCELSPGTIVLGAAQIGSNTFIGASSVILPKVKIGSNCIIGAGSIVNKDIPNNSKYAGVPARSIDL
jgi:sugar O-acyltransferase (sialic acid O-acetyltransferase NeuD family)